MSRGDDIGVAALDAVCRSPGGLRQQAEGVVTSLLFSLRLVLVQVEAAEAVSGAISRLGADSDASVADDLAIWTAERRLEELRLRMALCEVAVAIADMKKRGELAKLVASARALMNSPSGVGEALAAAGRLQATLRDGVSPGEGEDGIAGLVRSAYVGRWRALFRRRAARRPAWRGL